MHIYLLSKAAGGKPVAPPRVDSLTTPNAMSPLDMKEISDQPTKKQSSAVSLNPKCNEHALNKSLVVPSIVPRDSPDGKDSPNSTRESITFSKTKRGMLLKPAHTRRPSNSKNDLERLPLAVDSGTIGNLRVNLDVAMDQNFQKKTVSEDGARESCEEMNSNIKNVAEKVEKVLLPQTPTSQDSCKFLFYNAVIQIFIYHFFAEYLSSTFYTSFF